MRQPFVVKAALRFGEIARGISENGNGALVAPKAGRHKVLWCDGEASGFNSIWRI